MKLPWIYLAQCNLDQMHKLTKQMGGRCHTHVLSAKHPQHQLLLSLLLLLLLWLLLMLCPAPTGDALVQTEWMQSSRTLGRSLSHPYLEMPGMS